MAPLRAKNRENLEFATNLPDKEERKRVRRVRVERAIAAQDNYGLDTSKNDEETAACSLSQQQVYGCTRVNFAGVRTFLSQANCEHMFRSRCERAYLAQLQVLSLHTTIHCEMLLNSITSTAISANTYQHAHLCVLSIILTA